MGTPSLTSSSFARVTRTNGERSERSTTIRPSARAHCQAPSAVATPTSIQPSSGRASSNARMPPEIFDTFPTSTQLALPSNQVRPSTRIFTGTAPSRRCRSPVQRYASRPALQVALGVADHLRVETHPGHDRDVLAVHLAEVEPAALAMQPDADRLGQVVRDPEVGGEQVGRTSRDDGDGGPRTGQRVHAPLDHAVTAPDENQASAMLERLPDLPGRLPALRHLVPQWVCHPHVAQLLTQLVQPAVEGLPPVRDNGDLVGVGDRSRIHADRYPSPRSLLAGQPAGLTP